MALRYLAGYRAPRAEAAIAAKQGAAAHEEMPATQATQLATMSRATPTVTTVRRRVLPALGFGGVTNNARGLAALASLTAGALYAVWRITQAYVPEHVGWPCQERLCNQATVHPAYFAWPAGADWPIFVLQGVALAVIMFLAIAALRGAWRSYR
jgi:hypothetical protein